MVQRALHEDSDDYSARHGYNDRARVYSGTTPLIGTQIVCPELPTSSS
ncbi:hypothetical protein BH11MYX3_BH11MYX3_16050 [soil metagenome]